MPIKIHDCMAADLKPWDLRHDTHYFREENISIHCYQDSGHFKDLTNALKTGKTVTSYNVYLKDRFDRSFTLDIANWALGRGLTFPQLVKHLFDQTLPAAFNDTFQVEASERQGVRTFSPFVEVKPIKVPAKWTVAHIWKAILSGQITGGKTDMYLTDDYAGDAADNFRKDWGIILLDFAKKLIEDPSGWWINVGKETEEEIHLGVNCHHFDYKSLTFKKKAPIEGAKPKEQVKDTISTNVIQFRRKAN